MTTNLTPACLAEPGWALLNDLTVTAGARDLSYSLYVLELNHHNHGCTMWFEDTTAQNGQGIPIDGTLTADGITLTAHHLGPRQAQLIPVLGVTHITLAQTTALLTWQQAALRSFATSAADDSLQRFATAISAYTLPTAQARHVALAIYGAGFTGTGPELTTAVTAALAVQQLEAMPASPAGAP